MILNFIVHEIDKESGLWKMVSEHNSINQFIIIGEDEEYYKAVQIDKDGIKIIGGIKLDQQALYIPKHQVKVKKDNFPGVQLAEFDIPKEYLTLDVIETIQRLNE